MDKIHKKHKKQVDQLIFDNNAAPCNSIKLISAGRDGCVKKHIVDIDIAAQTASKESQLSAQAAKSVTIVKQEQWMTSIAMSNDTHTLFAANYNGIITQFQKEESSLNYYPVRTFKGHTCEINSISMSNSKMHLLSAGYDGTLRVWDLENGTQLACLNEEGKEHQSLICSCCWNDQDTFFASGDLIGDVMVWSPPFSIYNSSNQFIKICKFQTEGVELFISCIKFQESGLDLFASYSSWNSNVIRLWNIHEKELLDNKSTHKQNATLPLIQQHKRQSDDFSGQILSFDVRGSMLVVGVNYKMLLLSADSLQSMVDAIRFDAVHCGQIRSLVFSKNFKYVASGSHDGSVAIFDTESGKCLKHIKDAHSFLVVAVAFQI